MNYQLIIFNWHLLIPSDLASAQAMQDEIKLLNEKLDYLNIGNRRLHGLYDERGKQIQNLENELDTCEHQNGSNQDCEGMIHGMGSKYISSGDIWYIISNIIIWSI